MQVTVIIPTTCEARREATLRRAIESAEAPVMLVVNGKRFDSGLLEDLRSRHTVHYRDEGHLAKARHFGREMVKTPFFSFLDDDDEYLPGSINKRLEPMLADPSVDAVVGNGLSAGAVCVPRLAEAAQNPARAMLEFNWLPSCAGLFRTATVGLEFFDPSISHLEWTFTGFKLALARKLAFVDEPTYRINDTPDSLSKQAAYVAGHVAALQRMLSMTDNATLRRGLKSRLAAAHHDLASRHLSTDKRLARKHHIRSLFGPGGLRYLPFTRKVI